MRGPWNAVSRIKGLSGNPPITLLLDSLPTSLRESGLISNACVCVTIPGKPGNPCTLVRASKRTLSQACRYLKTCQSCCEPVSKYLELQSSLSASLMQAGAAVMLVTGMRSNSHRQESQSCWNPSSLIVKRAVEYFGCICELSQFSSVCMCCSCQWLIMWTLPFHGTIPGMVSHAQAVDTSL